MADHLLSGYVNRHALNEFQPKSNYPSKHGGYEGRENLKVEYKT